MESNLPIYGLSAPNCCKTIKIKSKIIDKSTKKPFEANLVNIYNTRSKKGTTADLHGIFSIEALPNDIISISFIGYKKLLFKASELPKVIKLAQKNEELKEVIITAKKKHKPCYMGISIGIASIICIYALTKKTKKTV